MSRLTVEFPCKRKPTRINTQAGLSAAHSCVLAIAAIHEIVAGHATRWGVLPKDTADITSADVGFIDPPGNGGELKGSSYFLVHLNFGARGWLLDIRFDREKEQILVLPAEGIR